MFDKFLNHLKRNNPVKSHNPTSLSPNKKEELMDDSFSNSDTSDDDYFDQLFKHKLNDLEATPEPHNWLAIEKNTPLHLKLRNQLSALSKIAAGIVIIMFLSTYIQLQTQKQTAETASQFQQKETISKVTPASSVQETQYVFDLKEQENNKLKSASEELSDEVAKKKEADEYLFLLLQDDEFGEEIDAIKIAEILEPVQQLPIENITAMLKTPETTNQLPVDQIELQIQIPLKVVEDYEVEALLKQYDLSQAVKKE